MHNCPTFFLFISDTIISSPVSESRKEGGLQLHPGKEKGLLWDGHLTKSESPENKYFQEKPDSSAVTADRQFRCDARQTVPLWHSDLTSSPLGESLSQITIPFRKFPMLCVWEFTIVVYLCVRWHYFKERCLKHNSNQDILRTNITLGGDRIFVLKHLLLPYSQLVQFNHGPYGRQLSQEATHFSWDPRNREVHEVSAGWKRGVNQVSWVKYRKCLLTGICSGSNHLCCTLSYILETRWSKPVFTYKTTKFNSFI